MPVDEALLVLQRHDTAVDEIRKRLAALPEARAMAAAEVLIRDHTRRLEEVLGELQEVERAKNRHETDVERVQQRIKAANDKLMGGNVTNPRELTALQEDIAMLERQRSSFEDDELEELVKIDELSAQRDEIQSELERLDSEVLALRERRETEETELQTELVGHEAARDAVAAGLDGSLLAVYERVRNKRGGSGAAALESGVCRACNLTLPAQDLHEVGDHDVPRCPHCEVILVLAGG